jgi:hypothetical protein
MLRDNKATEWKISGQTGLGVVLQQVPRFEEVMSALRDAVAIFRETGDRQGEGRA